MSKLTLQEFTNLFDNKSYEEFDAAVIRKSLTPSEEMKIYDFIKADSPDEIKKSFDAIMKDVIQIPADEEWKHLRETMAQDIYQIQCLQSLYEYDTAETKTQLLSNHPDIDPQTTEELTKRMEESCLSAKKYNAYAMIFEYAKEEQQEKAKQFARETQRERNLLQKTLQKGIDYVKGIKTNIDIRAELKKNEKNYSAYVKEKTKDISSTIQKKNSAEKKLAELEAKYIKKAKPLVMSEFRKHTALESLKAYAQGRQPKIQELDVSSYQAVKEQMNTIGENASLDSLSAKIEELRASIDKYNHSIDDSFKDLQEAKEDYKKDTQEIAQKLYDGITNNKMSDFLLDKINEDIARSFNTAEYAVKDVTRTFKDDLRDFFEKEEKARTSHSHQQTQQREQTQGESQKITVVDMFKSLPLTSSNTYISPQGVEFMLTGGIGESGPPVIDKIAFATDDGRLVNVDLKNINDTFELSQLLDNTAQDAIDKGLIDLDKDLEYDEQEFDR